MSKGILSDYKLTSVWKLIKGDMDEWTQQLNIYAAILRHNGYPVKQVQVIALLRDWSKREAERDPFYPQAQVVNVNLPLWDHERAVAFIRMRIAAHEAAKTALPECTPAERWAKDPVWAVKKKGAKRAVKLFATEDEARTFIGLDNALSLEYRPGESVRCQAYCSANRFCDFYKNNFGLSAGPTDEADQGKTA